MAFGGEIATAFVRIRPNVAGFASEANAGVRAGLEETEAAVAASTKANVSSTRMAVEANQRLASSYTTLGTGARGSLGALDGAVRAMAEAAAGAARSVESSFAGLGKSAAVAGEEMRAGLVGGVRRGATESEGFLARMKGRLLNLGTLIGVGFGAEIGLHFVKGISESAASVQKSVETIKATFGPDAAKVIVGFGDTVAAKLGISAELADATSAKFGILFKNLGIGVAPAATMTVNLEKLAGVLSAVRGIDPSAALQRITLAMLGNTRSLKQLGLAVDPVQEKLQAFKMGLIATTSDALTPAVRAQAIYALAVQHLGEFQRLASRHAGDLANQQRRLLAEWSNAKDQIGTALLPVFTRYTGHLADWLEKMIRGGEIQRDVNGALHAAGQAFQAVRIAIIPVVEVLGKLKDALGGARNLVIGFLAVWALTKLVAIGSAVSKIGTIVEGVGVAAKMAARAFGVASITMSAEAEATAASIKAGLISTGLGALIVAIGFVTAYVLTHWTQIKAFTAALARSIADIWGGLKNILIGTAKTIGGAMLTYLTLPLRGLLEAASAVSGFLGHFGIHIGGASREAIDKLKSITTDLVSSGAHQVAKGGAEIGHAFADAWRKSLQDAAKNAKPDEQAKASLYHTGKVLADAASQGMADVLAARQAGIAAAQRKLADAVQAANDSAAAARARVARTIRDTNAQIAAMIRAGNQEVAKAANEAATNLDTLGAKLANAVTKFLAKKTSTQSVANSALGAEFKRLRDAIASGSGGPELINAAQEVASELQNRQAKKANTSKVKEAVTRHVTALTDEFNKGEISFKQLQSRLLAYLRSLGASYSAVGKHLGKAQADAYEATVKAILKQAGIIAAEPEKLRRSVERHGAGIAPKVIDVQDVQAKIDRKVAAARAHAKERVAAARHQEVMAESARQRKILSATLTEQKAVAKYTGQTAANTRPSKPHKSATSENPGKTSKNAKAAATVKGTH